MTFDKPEHKEICLKMLDATTFPGQIVELILELKQAMQKAEVVTNVTQPE
jgi:hypothetical protein